MGHECADTETMHMLAARARKLEDELAAESELLASACAQIARLQAELECLKEWRSFHRSMSDCHEVELAEVKAQLAAESELLALANAQIERLQSGKSQIIDSLRQQVERQNNLIAMQQKELAMTRSDLAVARKANRELEQSLLAMRPPEPVDDEDDEEEHPRA